MDANGARNFVFYQDLSIKDVADACGFSYPAAFSRAFKAQVDQAPRTSRATLTEHQSLHLRPEIRRLITQTATGQ